MKSPAKIISGIFRGPRKKITDRMFPRFFAFIDHKRGTRVVPPLNHQSGRAAIMEAIIRDCGVEQVVETGTYRGSTTAWFAKFGIPVHTVEANRRFAHLARLNFATNDLVHPAEMDSAAFLDCLSKDEKLIRAATLFYLDAHWGKRLPLGEELRTVARAFPTAIIVIDDFQVADDASYGFDDYGPGKRLDLDYVKATGVSGLRAFFPTLRGAEEDGARRGCVVLTTNDSLADKLGRISLLRPYPL